jgi:hypothetical protein
MNRPRLAFWCATTLALSACLGLISGCGSDSGTGPVGTVALKLNVQNDAPGLASLVETVTLTVSYGSASLAPDTLGFDNGILHDTLSVVPGDSLTFILRAYDATGRQLFEGRQGPVDVGPGATLTLNILLRPSVPMLRAAPFVQSVQLGSDALVDVDVDVYNVDSLFGAAFRVQYDTTVLDFSGAVEGDFLKGIGTPAPTLAIVLKDSAGFVAYAVTRQNAPDVHLPGSSVGQDPGRLATFQFAKKHAGTTAITFNPATVRLDRPNGEQVLNRSGLVLESATVHVLAGP